MEKLELASPGTTPSISLDEGDRRLQHPYARSYVPVSVGETVQGGQVLLGGVDKLVDA